MNDAQKLTAAVDQLSDEAMQVESVSISLDGRWSIATAPALGVAQITHRCAKGNVVEQIHRTAYGSKSQRALHVLRYRRFLEVAQDVEKNLTRQEAFDIFEGIWKLARITTK